MTLFLSCLLSPGDISRLHRYDVRRPIDFDILLMETSAKKRAVISAALTRGGPPLPPYTGIHLPWLDENLVDARAAVFALNAILFHRHPPVW
jgi:hypothetical protein